MIKGLGFKIGYFFVVTSATVLKVPELDTVVDEIEATFLFSVKTFVIVLANARLLLCQCPMQIVNRVLFFLLKHSLEHHKDVCCHKDTKEESSSG